jgi:dihydroorotate dehydrogenase
MRLRQRVREFAYSVGFGIDEAAERRVLDGEAGVPPGSLVDGKLMAVQVAKNKFTPDSDIEAVKRDYVYCVDALAKYADIVVVNVSSPNTPGLRGLQNEEPLTHILKGVVEAAQRAERKTRPAVMVKVSPDEDSDAQISGICEAIRASGVDGVIVGNTTKRRPDPLPKGYTLSDKESALLLEEGGYSGPQLFERTLDLVKRYRRFLDQGSPGRSSTPISSKGVKPERARPEEGTHVKEADRGLSGRSSIPIEPKGVITERARPEELIYTKEALEPAVASKIESTVQRDLANLKESSMANEANSRSQPLIRLPERHDPFSSKPEQPMKAPALSASNHIDQLPPVKDTPPSPSSSVAVSPPAVDQPKVIFATGGITDGQQALEILNAGASVALVYTALVYGGLGFISSLKGQLREEIKRKKI